MILTKWYLKLMLGIGLTLMLFGNSVSAGENLPEDAWKVEILSPKEGFQYTISTLENGLKAFHFYAKSKELFFFPDYIVVRFKRLNEQSFFSAKKILPESGYFNADIGGFDFMKAGPVQVWAESWKVTNTANDKKVAQTEKVLIYLVDSANAADLALSTFEVVTLMPGEKALNGTISDKKRYHFVWTVKNVGDKIARASQLRIECQAFGDEDCPSSLNRSYDIKQLWPKPENISGAMKIWNVEPFLPTTQAKFRFKATIDPDNRLVEQDETNNQRVNEFAATPMDDLKVSIPTEKLKEIVAVSGQKDRVLPIVAPSISLSNVKHSYRPGENVHLLVEAEPSMVPQEEYFENGRWTTQCPPGTILQKTGLGAKKEYNFRASTAGKYRIRIGKILSEEIVVKPVFSKTNGVQKSSKAAIKVGKKRSLVAYLTAPKFEEPVPGQKFKAGESVKLKIKSNSKYKNLKVKYKLYKNSCRGNPFKQSFSPDIGKLPSGKYCVQATYVSGKVTNWSNEIPFVVERKKVPVAARVKQRSNTTAKPETVPIPLDISRKKVISR